MTAPRTVDDVQGPFALSPIGYVRSPYQRRFGTPQQATAADPAIDSAEDAVLALIPTLIPGAALADLEGMERLWVLSWLHRGGTWAAQVMPPRGPRVRRGLFATRSPDRPNPIGLSAVRLIRVEGCNLYVNGIDLIDGTPILDIKPYVPYADAFAQAKAGWIDAVPNDAPQFRRYEP